MAEGSVSALSLLRPARASLAFTAHRIAQPSKTAFVTTLQPCQLPNYVGVFSFARSRVGTFRKEMEAMKTEADWNSFGDEQTQIFLLDRWYRRLRVQRQQSCMGAL